MIKRIKLPGWIVIILLLTGIVFGINQVLTKALVESPATNETNETKEQIVESSVYPGLNIKKKTKETELYTLSVSQPYTDNEQINNSINNWIDKQKKEFTSGIKESKEMLEENGLRAHLNIQVETQKIADKLYTLEFNAYQITGGANGMTKLKPFVIDLNQNKQLSLDDVFQLDEEAITGLQELIRDELYSNQEISPYLFDEMVQKALDDYNKWKWSVTRDSVTFYFDEYEIAAGAAGSIKAEVSMKKIKSYLNEEFAEQIDMKIPEKQEHTKEEQHSEDRVRLDPNGKYVALTFDDGPHPEVTPRILDTLNKYDAKATFFMLGSQVEYYPSLANQVDDAGHEIGDHTMNHQDLSVLGLDQIQEEVQQSSTIIEKAIGMTPVLLRPPYGASNADVEQIASNLGHPLIMWSVDSLDWKNRNAEVVHENVMSNVASGSIVLLHDIHHSTAEALPQLLNSLEEQGYQMVTVSQLLELWDEKGVGPYYGK